MSSPDGKRARVGIVSVGDELLVGAHPDLNGPYLASRMVEFGRSVDRIIVVRDDEVAIAEAVTALAEHSAVVLVSGGLGPTLDDVTRHGVARSVGGPLVESAEAWAEVSGWFERAGRPATDSNRRQALLVEGSARIPNAYGTAPGFRAEHPAGSEVLVLPGPPRELQGVFEAEVAPWLAGKPVDDEERSVASATFADVPESTFAEAVGPWMERGANPLVGCTVKDGILTARAVAQARRGQSPSAESMAKERIGEIQALFADRYLGESVQDLGAFVGAELVARGLRVTAAESCTGGLVMGALTGAPGVSAVVHRSWVTYANAAKAELGVPEALLAAHGAVSGPVVESLAAAALERDGADLAIAISGIAGPGGGSDEKPVGLVWFAVASRGAGAPDVTSVSRRWPPLGRARVRRWATNKALTLLLAAARQRD